ncbi:MAG: ion channel [Chlamydiota bacterium]
MVEYHRRLYLSLMIAILAILILFPFLKDAQTGRLALSLLFLVVMLHALKVLAPRRHIFWFGFALAMAAGVGLPALMLVVKFPAAAHRPLFHACMGTYLAFLTLVIVVLVKSIFSGYRMTSDKIYAAISCYLLIGLLYAMFYITIEDFDPSAFGRVMPQWGGSASEMIYFSFTTLSTLGYGDLTPQTALAQTASYLEAITGQLFVAILIARLVGLNIAHTTRDYQNGRNE